MKRSLALVGSILLAASLHATKIKNMEVINDKGFKSADYSKLTLISVTADEFLKDHKDLKNIDAVSSDLLDINLEVKTAVGEYVRSGYTPGKGPKELKMKVFVSDFNAGSAAAAAFVGFGAGNGMCKYEVHLIDGAADVASFECTSRIAGRGGNRHPWGGGSDLGGEGSKARIPKNVALAIEQFLRAH